MIISKNKKGFTLIEILVACTVFTLFAMALFALFIYAQRHWRNIEDRAVIQKETRRIEGTLNEDVRRTSYESILTYQGDYRHTLAFKSFIDPNTNKFMTDSAGDPEGQGYILYTLLRPKDDTCPFTVNGANPEYVCPHKVLVRVELTRNDDLDQGGATTWPPLELADTTALMDYIPGPADKKLFSTKMGLAELKSEYISSITGDGKYVRSVKLIGKSVLGFDVQKSPPPDNLPEVEVDLKFVRLMEISRNATIGSQSLENSRFTFSVKNRILPRNP